MDIRNWLIQAKKQRVAEPATSNHATPQDVEFFNEIFEDAVVVKVREDDMREGNRMSGKSSKFLTEKYFDTYNAQGMKMCKNVNRINPDVDGFEGEPISDNDHLQTVFSESRRFVQFCEMEGDIILSPFIQGYFPGVQEEGSNKVSLMASHTDQPIARYHNGIEPKMRLGFTRFADLEGDESDDELYKIFEWKRRIQGTKEYNFCSVGIPDGGVLVMGSKASGKSSNIMHQPKIHKRNSISLMIDVIFKENSRFKDWTIPQFVQYLVACGVFENNDYLHVRYGN